MRVDRVRNWEELNAALFENSWYAPHGRFRSPFLFRGMTNAKWDLKTSLMRLGGMYPDVELSMLRNFRKYAHRDAARTDSFWHWMAVAQHHGLPTRLLDWTFSPHVAAHFATDDPNDAVVDGVVWALDVIRIHDLLPGSLRDLLSHNGAFVFTSEILDGFASTLPVFDENLRDAQPVLLFLEPPSLDDRIVNQAGLLSLMAPATARLDDWLEERCPHLARKIIIPASVKREVRDKLDMMNVSERMIYPGLDGLSKWLKRYYSPVNLMELTYTRAHLVQDTRVAVVEKAENGVLFVRVFSEDADCGTTQLQSQDDGRWIDIENGCGVTIKATVSRDRCKAALQYLFKLREDSWTERRLEADKLLQARSAAGGQ